MLNLSCNNVPETRGSCRIDTTRPKTSQIPGNAGQLIERFAIVSKSDSYLVLTNVIGAACRDDCSRCLMGVTLPVVVLFAKSSAVGLCEFMIYAPFLSQ